MDYLSIALGAIGVVAVWLNLATSRRLCADRVGASMGLLGSWAFGLLISLVMTPPESKAMAPAFDLLIGAWLACTFRTRPRSWKLAFLSLLSIQAGAHIVYAITWAEPGALATYARILAVLYVGQVASTASSGVSRLVQDLSSRWLRLHHRPAL